VYQEFNGLPVFEFQLLIVARSGIDKVIDLNNVHAVHQHYPLKEGHAAITKKALVENPFFRFDFCVQLRVVQKHVDVLISDLNPAVCFAEKQYPSLVVTFVTISQQVVTELYG